jgi:rsbT co-antagonist protein RsbR
MTPNDLSVEQLQIENTSLRQRLAEVDKRAQMLEEVTKHLPFTLTTCHLENLNDPTSLLFTGMYTGSLPSAGGGLNDDIGKKFLEVFPNVTPELLETYAKVIRSGKSQSLGELSYFDERFGQGYFELMAIPLAGNCLCVVSQDIGERKRAEDALRQLILQEETIRAQQATLAELSTPLIPLSTQVLVMPLIGSVDSRRAQQVIETLLEGISGSGARVAILDITGVPVVDTQVANALIRAAQAVKLLGAQVVLTGIRPEVAQTLVGLGTDLSGVVTRSSLQSGIAYATSQNIN